MRSICITGAPGAGKTSVAKAVAATLDMQHYSSGDLARRLAATNKEVNDALKRGDMAPRDIMDDLMRARLREGGMVLDGYPRYREQMEHVMEAGAMVVMLHLTPEQSLERIRTRRRDDYDRPMEEHRIELYGTQTYPLAFWVYKQGGLNINGAESLARILAKVKHHWHTTGGHYDRQRQRVG